MSFFSEIFVKRVSDGTKINPAQEDGHLSTLADKDFATETTLSLINSGVDTSSGLLTDIKANQTNATQQVKITDGSAIAGVDDATNSLQTIDIAHHEIHEGESFLIADYNTALTTRDYLLIAPATKYCHLVVEFSTDQRVTCTIYRTPTTSANGTAMVEINRNHASTNVAALQVFHTPTVSATGTNIVDRYMVGSGEKAGGQSRSDQEMILNPSTTYLIRFAGTNFIMNTRLLWYEETV